MSLDHLYLLPPDQQQAVLNGPALTPPAGIVPNLDNPPNGNTLCIIIVTFLLFLGTSAVTLAIYVKLFYVKKLYLEDCENLLIRGKLGSANRFARADLAFSGFVLYIAQVYTALNIFAHTGLFVHQWNIRVKNLANILYMVHIGSEFYAVCILLFKAAILLEWIRIFVPRATRGAFFWTCNALLLANVLFYTAILISANVSCKPYAKPWDKTLRGTCSNKDAFDVATAAYNFISDLLILLLPQRIIWRLRLGFKKKMGIAVIFAIGIAACTAAAYRLYASIRYLEEADATYGIAGIALGTEAESVCAILVFYVPTLPKAFKDIRNFFRPLGSIFSWSKSQVDASTANSYPEWPYPEYKPICSHNSHQSVGYLRTNTCSPYRQSGSGLAYPYPTYIPRRSILYTTQVTIDEAGRSGSIHYNPQISEHYSQVNLNEPPGVYNHYQAPAGLSAQSMLGELEPWQYTHLGRDT